jgi:hypothetical protein
MGNLPNLPDRCSFFSSPTAQSDFCEGKLADALHALLRRRPNQPSAWASSNGTPCPLAYIQPSQALASASSLAGGLGEEMQRLLGVALHSFPLQIGGADGTLRRRIALLGGAHLQRKRLFRIGGHAHWNTVRHTRIEGAPHISAKLIH